MIYYWGKVLLLKGLKCYSEESMPLLQFDEKKWISKFKFSMCTWFRKHDISKACYFLYQYNGNVKLYFQGQGKTQWQCSHIQTSVIVLICNASRLLLRPITSSWHQTHIDHPTNNLLYIILLPPPLSLNTTTITLQISKQNKLETSL